MASTYEYPRPALTVASTSRFEDSSANRTGTKSITLEGGSMSTITSFAGDHAFLSNFYPALCFANGIVAGKWAGKSRPTARSRVGAGSPRPLLRDGIPFAKAQSPGTST
jgi:hypothetical protein